MMPWAIALLLVSVQAASASSITELKENWRRANSLCWQEVEADPSAASATGVKVACITLGILTQRLIDKGYCLDASKNEWERC